jgi:large subunit ribosomal protein L2
MPIKIYKPTSAGRRNSSVDAFDDITKTEPEKSLIVFRKKHSGRNNQGKITTRHQGGGAKQYYRLVDFRQDKFDMPAKVNAIEYDPNRGARIALVEYTDGEKRYVLAPIGFAPGIEFVSSKSKIEIKVGNRMPLEYIPVGIMVYNIELTPGKGGEIVRSAGAGAQIVALEGDHATVKMPSGEIRKILKNCLASVGQVSNPDHMHVRWGKAGRMRHKGKRPEVRGKAMNPIDHPHGGGEGNQPIGLKHPKTPWGKPALGVKTRKKKSSDKLIIQRRK